MDVMLDFICMGPVDLQGARRKRQNTKFLSTVELEPTTLRSEVWHSIPTEIVGRVESCPYYMHVLSMYKFENDEGERILSCKCTVLCYILKYIYMYISIYCTNSKETYKSCVCFQHANTTKHSSWSGICTLKANTGLMCLFAICTIKR